MKPARIVLPALLAVALSACGSGSDGPPTGTVPPPVTASDPTTSVPVTASDTVAPPSSASPQPATVADPPDQYRPPDGYGVYFFTPSRNIACGLDAGTVGCQVFKTAVIPPGADCDHGTMPRDEMSKGYYSDDGGAFTPSCFNQGLFFMVIEQKTLQYGHSVTAGGMTCLSEAKGVTCRRGERGFFVSAQSFQQW